MRVPHWRAGAALLVAALALTAVDVTLLHVASSAPSAGIRALPPHPVAGGDGLSAHSADRSAVVGRVGTGALHGHSGNQPARGTERERASAKPAAASPVSLTGAAALSRAHVHPGYDSAADAVDGFYQGLLSGTPTQACAYATQPCSSFGSGRITGQVSIINAVSDGADALVEVSGTICRSVSCVPLSDRVIMPAGRASFGTSWTSLIRSVYGWAGSPLPCVRDAATGQWHVKLS